MSTLHSQPGLAIIADDESTGRVLLEESVAQAGLEALSFDNGTDALAEALRNEVAIVLLDVDMPGLNGYEVCRRLRSEARFATTPIVMVTGHEDSDAITLAFEAGATDFISKPVNWALLPRRLEYILRNAAQARALIASAERIERLAYFDTLTGLPNRQRCMEAASAMFDVASAVGRDRRRHLYRLEQPQARQRHVRSCHGRCGVASVRGSIGAAPWMASASIWRK